MSQPSSVGANKSFEQIVLSTYTCAQCLKTLKGPILLPCAFKMCREHAKLGPDRTMACPNPKCSAKEHKAPENLDAWNVETDASLEALDLLNRRQSLNELIDEFEEGVGKLEQLRNEPQEYLAGYLKKKNTGKLQDNLSWLVKFADDFMADANDVVVNFNANQKARLAGIQKEASVHDLDLEITKAKTIIEKLNQDRARIDKLTLSYLNNAFAILESFKSRSSKHLQQLEKHYVEKVYSDELRILDMAKKFQDRLGKIITNCEEAIGKDNKTAGGQKPKSVEREPETPPKMSQIQKVISSFKAPLVKSAAIGLVDKAKAHSLRIMSLCWNAQNTTAYTGSDDCSIKKWRLESGKIEMLGQLKAHTAKVVKMAVNPEGTLLASSSEDSVVNLWNLRTDTLLHTFKNSYGFEFSPTRADSPNGCLVTYGENESKKYFITFSSYDKATLELDQSSSSFTCGSKVNCAAFSPNSAIFLTGLQSGNVELFSLADPKQKPKKIWQRRLSNMNSSFPIKFIKFANNAQEFIVCCDFGANVLFEFKNEEIKRKLDLIDADSSIEMLKKKYYMVGLDAASWTKDDRHFVVVSNYIIKIWSTSSGKLLHKLNKHTNIIKTLIPHPTLSNVVATAGYDRRIVVWNVEKGSVLAKFKPKVVASNEYEHFFTCASWLGSNHLLASDLDGCLSYFELPADSLPTDFSPSPHLTNGHDSAATGAQEASTSTQKDDPDTVTINLASLTTAIASQKEASQRANFSDAIEECNFSELANQAGTQQSGERTKNGVKRRSSPRDHSVGESPGKAKRSS